MTCNFMPLKNRQLNALRCALLVGAIAVPAWIGSTTTAKAASSTRTLSQVTPPTIDIPYVATPPRLGLDNAIWDKGALISGLSLAVGGDTKGLKPMPTQVRLLWSQKGLYIRFLCSDNSVYVPEKGRDAPIWKGDVVEVFLDAKGDARQWIELQVSPNGDMFDQLATLTAEPHSNENRVLKDEVLNRDWWTNLSWNLDGWQARTTRNLPTSSTRSTKSGHDWRVDTVITTDALRRLGLSEFKPMTMRLNLIRYKYLPASKAGEKRRLLPMNWAPTMFGCPHISPQAMGFARLMPPTIQTESQALKETK